VNYIRIGYPDRRKIKVRADEGVEGTRRRAHPRNLSFDAGWNQLGIDQPSQGDHRIGVAYDCPCGVSVAGFYLDDKLTTLFVYRDNPGTVFQLGTLLPEPFDEGIP